MKAAFNGKERDAEDWAALAARVHPRLRLDGISTPEGSLLSIITTMLE